MTHPRKTIRSSITARLVADATFTSLGMRVAASRIRVTQETHLPRCLVFFSDDDVEREDSISHREETRFAALRIAFQVDADDGDAAQDLLDDLAEIAEQVVMEDETHGGAANRTSYASTEATYEDDGERLIAGCVLTWEVEYPRTYTPRTLPDAEGIDADIDVPSETPGQVEAQADVTLETT